jgi:hypothetical protein
MTIPNDQYRAALGAVEYPPLTAEGRVSYMEQTAVDVVLAVTPLIEKALRARLFRAIRDGPSDEPRYPYEAAVNRHPGGRRHPHRDREVMSALSDASCGRCRHLTAYYLVGHADAELSRPRHPALVRDDILAAIEAK